MKTTKSKRNRYRKIVNWVFFLLLIGVVVAISMISYKESQNEAKWRLQDYQATESVYRGDLQLSIQAPATLQAFEVVQVRPEASGKIEKLMFDVGDWVKEGEPLAMLDQKDLLTRLDTAKAALKQAQANLEGVRRGYYPRELQSLKSALDSAQLALNQAQKNLDRIRILHEKGFASDVELETSENAVEQATQARDQAAEALNVLLEGSTSDQIKAAEAAVEMAQAGVAEAENAVGNSIIYAPMSGIILERLVTEGSVVVSNLAGFGGGDIICTIGHIDKMKAISNVNEGDIGSVKNNLSCKLDVDAFPDMIFEGKVIKIHPQATNVGGVTSFVTEIEVPNPDHKLMVGMTCEVEIITEVIKDILLVPDRAIAQKNNRNYVFVVNNDEQIEAREINIGRTNYDVTEVLSGLSEGEAVIVKGVPRDLLDEKFKDEKNGEYEEENRSKIKVEVK